MLLKILLYFILTVLLLFFPTQVGATVLFEDSFSDNLTQWQAFPDTGAWNTVDGKLQAQLTKARQSSFLIPEESVWNSNWQNYSFEVELLALRGADANIPFLFIDPLNWYELHFYGLGHNIVQVSGGAINSHFNFFGPDRTVNSQTYKIRIDLLQGIMKIWLNGVVLAEKAYSPQLGSKIALRATTGSVFPTIVLFDNVFVRSFDEGDVQLPLPLYKQTDLAWSDREYDHAASWSTDPTLFQWGCAVSSMAMLLQFHGIDRLPDQSRIDPASLNTWLSSQPDGYIGPGLLNWIAITRLTKILATELNTPILEYRRLAGSELTAAQTNLFMNQPSILEIPGHFVVATGTEAATDLFIHDPYFEYPRLADHQANLVSTRTFTPSQTDLSYLLVIAPVSAQLKIWSATGEPVPAEQFQEQLTSAERNEAISAQILQIAQPTENTYFLLATGLTSTEQLQIFAYSKEGNVEEITLSGEDAHLPVQINFSPENQTTFSNSYLQCQPEN